MGKSQKPLRIAVTDSALARHPKFEALRAQGHIIEHVEQFIKNDARWDIIIGPGAWHATETHVDQFLDTIITYARKVRYGSNVPEK